eukprot:CAMPEP_0118869532 /NCGR_PEP_ID=MMETSP1163-20130328/12839_1 /TAXON_ID=124430 /ORGANISM="Phaeomonas parva, Strain CCMP2877" /LENGTH=311 /DNA_ID=CAMNT_0006804435 /DNA_START=55 /DNA_END=990 /DNA_ORIENTATION=+
MGLDRGAAVAFGVGLSVGLGIGLALVPRRFLARLRSSPVGSPPDRPPRTIIGTRIHCRNASQSPNLEPLSCLMRRCASAGIDLAIAVGVEGEAGIALLSAVTAESNKVVTPGAQITVLPVEPWGSFVPGLHAILGYAATNAYDLLLLQSVEVETSPETLKALQSQVRLERGDLVAGVALPGHEFREGRVELTGRTTPWNTLALWNVRLLAKTGFLGVAEGWARRVEAGEDKAIAAGVEEATAIAVAQTLDPARCRAALLRLPGISWETDFKDPERKAWHERKMKSKLARAAAQLSALGADKGYVHHIDLTV